MTCRCPDAQTTGMIARSLGNTASAAAFRRDLQVVHRQICEGRYPTHPDYSSEWLMKMKRRGLKTLRTHGYVAFEEQT